MYDFYDLFLLKTEIPVYINFWILLFFLFIKTHFYFSLLAHTYPIRAKYVNYPAWNLFSRYILKKKKKIAGTFNVPSYSPLCSSLWIKALLVAPSVSAFERHAFLRFLWDILFSLSQFPLIVTLTASTSIAAINRTYIFSIGFF